MPARCRPRAAAAGYRRRVSEHPGDDPTTAGDRPNDRPSDRPSVGTGVRTSTVRTSDGLDLAVYEQGPLDAPVVVLVHGYPDDHSVWDGVAERLATDRRVVRYDVRGSGRSETPSTTAGYALPQLADDLRTVIAAASPDAPVNLVGHDWGSIQAWEVVTDPTMRDRLTSYTSISGPSLGMTGAWLKRSREHRKETLRQMMSSYYILAFQLPVLPEALIRAGVLDRLVAHSGSIGVAPQDRREHPRSASDALHGLALYRANIRGKGARSRPRPTTVPVQVVAPRLDAHVTVALQTQAPVPYCTDFHWRVIRANHWAPVSAPDVVTDAITGFVAYAEGGPLPEGLDSAG
jgi:pimeloyl-ACP methyl ester carboxylesterase